MTHPLDRLVWNALNGPHAQFAEGGALARRYQPDIIPFAASVDRSAESLAALAALAKPGEVMVLFDTEPPALPPGLPPRGRARWCRWCSRVNRKRRKTCPSSR